MRFNIISNLSNGVGLQQDFVLLKNQLELRGHEVQGVQFNAQPFRVSKADVNIFLETVTPAAFPAAKEQWAVPNPEWWFHEWDHWRWDKVLAKTRDCERIFTARVGTRCQYIGWLARDLYLPEIPRERKFLHVSGKSQFKNTQAVIAGCQHAGVPLTLVGEHFGQRRRVTEQALRTLMNSHFCHVMPSAYEGYGHILHEAQGVGQLIITTDASPMNEVTPAHLVPSTGSSAYHSGLLHRVSEWDIARTVTTLLAMPDAEVEGHHHAARAQFQRDRSAFQRALDGLVGEVL